MYTIRFYEDSSDKYKLWEFLEELREKAERDNYLARKEADRK